ncbi:pectate lyase family protein [Fodinibius salsisoli]|uniref:Pectate lyase n=1 Tax=Fodinibius salsisoli TaxID=2820877 RepID=A0ABT3PKV9_9BACT|nr:hypothetical protein [Fodinibius salsisoli]MCW9706578.1 hypothetical protein [Fodinibius salsisoli]
MKKIKPFVSLFCVALLFSVVNCSGNVGSEPDPEGEEPTKEEAKAFPGAEGFGQDATGGRGGKVLYVTNLNDSGEGSLRAAIETFGPRIILFKVSGTIALESNLDIDIGDVTIAGQTAPGGGITLKNYSMRINADNVILRFLRFRMGDEAGHQGDALEGRFHKNIIVDHCSMSWATDETVTFYANENTTVQWSIIAESLRKSVHEKGAHGYGGIWGGRNASFHHNLLAHHDSRNPRLGEEAGKAFALTDLVDLRNNVIYNWDGNSTYGGEAMNVNIVNSYYKPGPATTKEERIIAIDKNLDESTAIYDTWGKFHISGNYMEGSERATDENWTYGVYNQFHSKYGDLSEQEKEAMRMAEPHPIDGNVTTHTALEAYDRVLGFSGASLVRDAVDTRIISDIRNRTYTAEGSNGSTNGIIDSQADVGGWPELESEDPSVDTDQDGMSDEWEIDNGLDPEKANANGRDLSTAYDNVEVYINSLVTPIVTEQNQ